MGLSKWSVLCAGVLLLGVTTPLTAAYAQEPQGSQDSQGSQEPQEPPKEPQKPQPSAEPAGDETGANPDPAYGPTAPIASQEADKGGARARADVSAEERFVPEEAEPEDVEPSLSMSAHLGAGMMRGGHGSLTTAQRSPLVLDVQVLTVREPRYLVGGALRIELEGSNSVAGIARLQLRHPFGPLELRPGVGLPFYFAPRTMLGAEAYLMGRLGLSKDWALLVALSAAAFMIGNDIPHGSTVILLQTFCGIELFI